jgi:hypothetical protein
MESVAAGLSHEEIAQKLGISTTAVRKSKSDAYKAVQEFIRPDGEYKRPTAPAIVQRRSVSRAVDQVIELSASLAAPHRDLRAIRPDERAETDAETKELRELLRRCPAGAFGAVGSAMVLGRVAAMATVQVSDRDEWAALDLIRTAHSHLDFTGPHPAGCDLKRAYAEALCELGYPGAAQKLLGGLSETERQVSGTVNPRTTMLLLWAQAMSGLLLEAETGFRDLEARLAQSRGSGTPMLLHVQCRRSWVQGALGQVSESASGYDGVILHRSRELGSDSRDAIDGGHSKGKMLVFNGAGSQAVTILQSVVEDRARVQGNDHSDTLETQKYLHLARVLAEPRDDRVRNSAIESLKQVLGIQKSRHRSEYYPMIRDTAIWLAWLHQDPKAIRGGEPVPIPRQFRPPARTPFW